MIFRHTTERTYRLTLIAAEARTHPEANSATPPDACPNMNSEWTMSRGMRRPLSTITKAKTGAQTIGCLTVSARLAARTESCDAGGDAESSPSCAAKLARCEPPSAVSNVRKRIVAGTTVRLMTRLAIAIGMALDPPKRSPRTAGPTKGTAGAEAVNAYRALTLVGKRKIIRWKRNTTP